MAQFQRGYVLTKAGAALLTQVENKECTLNITRAKLGSGTVASVDDYYERNDLVEPRANIAATSTSTKDNVFSITFTVANISIDAGFSASEIGIFANNKAGNEILFAVSYDENPAYIYDKNTAANVINQYTVNIGVSSAGSVNITLPIDAAQLVSIAGTYALNAQDAQKSALDSKIDAENAATRASTESGNAATSASNAAISEKDAAASADEAANRRDDTRDIMHEVRTLYDSMSYDIYSADPSKFDGALSLYGMTPEQMGNKQGTHRPLASSGIQYYIDEDGELCYKSYMMKDGGDD